MEKIYELVDRQHYQEALNQLIFILQEQLDQPSLEIIELLNGILGLNTKNQKLQISLLKLIRKEDTQKYYNLQLNLARLYIDQQQYDEAIKILFELKNINNPQLQWIASNMIQMLQNNCIEVTKEEQWLKFQELQQEENDLDYFQQDGLPTYLIPYKWFNQWRAYVTGEDLKILDDPLEGVDNLHLRKLLNIKDDSIDEEDNPPPGPIDGSRLIEPKWNLMIDPTPQKQYMNFILKQNLNEGTDFTIIGSKVYRYLESIYGGFPIKRLIVAQNEQQRVFTDLVPRVIEFIIIEGLEIYSLSMNGFDQIQDLTVRVRRFLGNGNEMRWWKFNNIQAQNDWFQMIQKGSLIKSVKAQELKDKQNIDDLCLTSQDILICEIKNGKSWQLNQEQFTPIKSDKHISEVLNKFGISSIPRILSDSRKGLTGLQNLGNTCFMNAALQCLSNTYEITEYMTQNKFVQDLNPNNVLGARGFLASSYGELMKSMWYGNYQNVSAIDLKRVISKFAPQFYGYGQQDSHEFLSYLLDGLHEDLNRIVNKPIVTDIEITNESDLQASEKFWLNYTLRNQSKIQELMVGQYKSTLVCPLCKRISKTFDPFMSLSLPIPNYQPFILQLYFIYDDTDNTPSKISLPASSEMSALDIIKSLEKILSIDHQQMNMILVKEHQIRDRVLHDKSAKWVHEHDGILFVNQVQANIATIRPDQVNIDYVYLQKGEKIYDEKILSFPRQIVVNRNLTNAELYGLVYNKFRIHMQLSIKEINERDFIIKNEYLALPKPKNLEENINEFNVLKEKNYQPFKLKLKLDGKSIDIDFNYNSIQINEKNPYLEVIISNYLLKNSQQLKLQRCKEFEQQKQKSDQRKGEYDVQDCLRTFTKEEILGKGDEWYCNKCKTHVQASKKMEIYKAPKILIIHLKRFKTNRINNFGNYYFSGGTQKITSMVTFPHELNLNQFILSKQNGDNQNYIYDLYGVDNHYGGLGGGHYTASAYNSTINKWVDFNDAQVRVTSSDVASEAAYLLFYRRRDAESCQLFKQ